MHLVRKEILVILAIAKSKVIYKIINRASDNVVLIVLRLQWELPLTEKEQNEFTKKSEINSECFLLLILTILLLIVQE